jgi:hypothetical protein
VSRKKFTLDYHSPCGTIQLTRDDSRNRSCLDSFLINGRGQRICPDISLLTPFASPVAGPLTDKACPLPNSTLSMGPVRNYTAQYPDQVPARLYQGCSNTSNVRVVLILSGRSDP